MEQMTLFDFIMPKYEITKKIRLIECFAGYGSQAMALRNIGADFETYRVYEIDKYAIASYNAIHGTNFETTDISNIKGVDLGIVDRSRFTYLLTYLLLSMHGYQRGWTDAGVSGRQRNEIITIVADRQDIKRMQRNKCIAGCTCHGKCSSYSFKRQYKTLSKVA